MASKKNIGRKTTRTKTNTVRLGVIGVGGMGNGHCRQMRAKVREAKLAAVCDIVPEVADKVGAQYGVPAFYKHEDLIQSGLCDAVTIATPHPSHAPIAIDCMNAGLHVLCEKPLSERISTGERMVTAAKKNKVAFAVMFQNRYGSAWHKALKIARDGELGTTLRATMVSPEYRSQAYYDSGGWRATWAEEGGGVMMNQSPHILDLFVHLTGMPTSVIGRTETRAHHIEVEDVAEALLRFEGGGSGTLYCSTNEPQPGQMIEIFGDKGKLILRDGELRFFRYKVPISQYTRESTQMWGKMPFREVNLNLGSRPCGHYLVIRNFVRHILNGEELICPGESGLASLELANAITLSSHTGKEVRFPISRTAYDRLLAKLRRESTFKKKTRDVKRETDPAHTV